MQEYSEQIQIKWETEKDHSGICCFTGPRPQKFSFKFNEDHADCISLKKRLKEKICEAAEKGITEFICGGALGFDTWAAQAVLELKAVYSHIKLCIAVPCMGHNSKWTLKQKLIYEEIIGQADCVYYVSEKPYFKGCMALRNRYMVDHAALVIGVETDKGGTGQTLRYAKAQGKEIWYV